MPMELGKLGTVDVEVVFEDGSVYQRRYDPSLNPLLIHGVEGKTAGGPNTPQTPNTYATLEAAAIVAQFFHLPLTIDKDTLNWNVTARAYALQVGERTVNIGRLLMVLGNDPGFATPRIKSYAICAELGIMVDETVADRLYDALVPAALPRTS